MDKRSTMISKIQFKLSNVLGGKWGYAVHPYLVIALLFSNCQVTLADIVGDQTTLPPPFITPSVSNPPKIVHWPTETKPTAPPGFEVSVFAEGLHNPRWLYILPNGDVLLAESASGRIQIFRDTDGDGKPDTQEIFLDGLNKPFGMALLGDSFYVANTNSVMIFPYKANTLRIDEPGKKIVDLPAAGYNNHWTRNLLLDPVHRKLYITVGSGTNVDEEGTDKVDSRRAAISQCNLDGSELKTFASGTRNPVGLAFYPDTHILWTAVNERDGLGDDLVPDYLTSIKEGGFYGWPYCYYGKNLDPRHKGERLDLVDKAIVPDFSLGSHVAALGLAFCPTTTFPNQYHNGAFIGEHGSWNRSKRVGYKVAFVPFKNGKPDGKSQTFLGGFVPSETGKGVYGRPVGVAFAHDGSLLVTDDGSNKIWRVTWHGSH